MEYIRLADLHHRLSHQIKQNHNSVTVKHFDEPFNITTVRTWIVLKWQLRPYAVNGDWP